MSVARILNTQDVDYLRSIYPDTDLPYPTTQQVALISYFFRGLPVPEAARAAGYKATESAKRYLDSAPGIAFLRYLQEREFYDIRVTRDSLTQMFLDAYHTAGNSMEKIAATRELGKLHGLYLDTKKLEVSVTNAAPVLRQLSSLEGEKLVELSGPELTALLSPPEPIEAEVVREDAA